jgi:hypothetical protein
VNDYPRTRQGLEKAGFHKTGNGVCRGCDAPIEWWKTPRGKSIPITVIIRGRFEELVMHAESCPNRGEFLGAEAGANARPPRKYSNEEAVRAMRDRTNARVVVLIDDNGTTAYWRSGIPAEDLRNDLISAGTFVRAEIYKGDKTL